MRPGKIAAIIIALALIAGGGAFFYSKSRDAASGRAAAVSGGDASRAAPGFVLKDETGREHGLDELRGQLVVLHFWASWCPPCVEEIPLWMKLARKFRGRPVRFVAVSTDKKWEDAHRVLPSEGLPENVLSLIDPENSVPEKYGSFQFPETYILGSVGSPAGGAGSKDLLIRDKWVGAQDWDNAAVQARLEEFLK
jgi:thiol-disulfide isomerase/thioredoxin